jgi:hypothetical protein
MEFAFLGRLPLASQECKLVCSDRSNGKGGNMSQISQQKRDEIINSVGSWAEALESKVKDQLGKVEFPGKYTPQEIVNLLRQIMVEFSTLTGGVVFTCVEQGPAWLDGHVGAEAMVKTVFQIVTEEKFTAGVIKELVDMEKIIQNLVSNPQVIDVAKKYGLPPGEAARLVAENSTNIQTQTIRVIASLIFKEAMETSSTTMLEGKLEKVIGGIKS